MDQELDSDIQSFHRLDRQVLLTHWSLARHLDGGDGRQPGRDRSLLERYHFHMAVQSLLQTLLGEQGRLQAILDALAKASELSPEDFKAVRSALLETLEGEWRSCSVDPGRKPPATAAYTDR